MNEYLLQHQLQWSMLRILKLGIE